MRTASAAARSADVARPGAAPRRRPPHDPEDPGDRVDRDLPGERHEPARGHPGGAQVPPDLVAAPVELRPGDDRLAVDQGDLAPRAWAWRRTTSLASQPASPDRLHAVPPIPATAASSTRTPRPPVAAPSGSHIRPSSTTSASRAGRARGAPPSRGRGQGRAAAPPAATQERRGEREGGRDPDPGLEQRAHDDRDAAVRREGRDLGARPGPPRGPASRRARPPPPLEQRPGRPGDETASSAAIGTRTRRRSRASAASSSPASGCSTYWRSRTARPPRAAPRRLRVPRAVHVEPESRRRSHGLADRADPVRRASSARARRRRLELERAEPGPDRGWRPRRMRGPSRGSVALTPTPAPPRGSSRRRSRVQRARGRARHGAHGRPPVRLELVVVGSRPRAALATAPARAARAGRRRLAVGGLDRPPRRSARPSSSVSHSSQASRAAHMPVAVANGRRNGTGPVGAERGGHAEPPPARQRQPDREQQREHERQARRPLEHGVQLARLVERRARSAAAARHERQRQQQRREHGHRTPPRDQATRITGTA